MSLEKAKAYLASRGLLDHVVELAPSFPCASDALPHSSIRKDPDNRLSLHLEAPSRIELENEAFAELCLTAWPWRHSGAVDEIRTRDIHLGKVALYH